MSPSTRAAASEPLVHELLINIDVADLNAAVRFYTAAFDLRIGRRFGAAAVELLGAKVPIFLLLKAEGVQPFVGSDSPRSYQRHWTPVHLDFVVSDLDRAIRRAEAAGASREGGPSAHSWGKMALFADPWGNGFCLLQLTGRGYDAIATG